MPTKSIDQHIEIIPNVVDGKPHIAGHRITVKSIVIWHEVTGKSADEIATEHGLSLSDVYAALTYYYDHQVEIDESIKDSESCIEELRRQIPSKIAQKLYERKD